MASYLRYGSRNFRSLRHSRRRHESEEDSVQLDYEKAPVDNVREILLHIVTREGITKGHKLGYLNSFVTLCNRCGPEADLGFSKAEIFCCLRVAFFHETCEVRAAALRAIRYLLQDKASAQALYTVQLQLLIARCLDIVLDNRIERLQAVRLVRRLLVIDPEGFPRALTHCLVAIANDSAQDRDILVKACLGTLTELALLNPVACAEAGGLHALLHNVQECPQPQIGEVLLGVILFLLTNPVTRHLVRASDLEQILTPFTDCHYQFSGDSSDHSLGDDREARFATCRMALASALRSWTGLMYLGTSRSSGLQSLVDMLYLPYGEIRKNIMDLLFEVFCLPVPEWTDDFSVAVLSSDPYTKQDSWQLYEGFVAAEGCTILPHIARYRTNLVDNYLGLVLLTFLTMGLLEALVEVITTSDMCISVRATILLGELLHLTTRLLPTEYSHHCHCLPSLMAVASSCQSTAKQRNQASAALSCLHRFHELQKRNPVPCSLFLDQLLQYCNPLRKRSGFFGSSMSRSKLRQCLRRDVDDVITQAIKDTQVLNKEHTSWDWDLVGSILKWPGDTLRKLEDATHRTFLKRLLQFFKPTSKQFSTLDIAAENARQVCIVGCHLVDFLLEAEETKCYELIDEFLTDLNLCLSQIATESAPLNAVLSPNRLDNTTSQAYFLFLGRLSSSGKGKKLMEKSGVFQYLLELAGLTSQDIYMKLIVSSLDYSKDSFSRVILNKVLTASSESARLYGVNYLRVLLRAGLSDFRKWAIELLVTQLYDKSQAVSLTAADILDEACDSQENLEALIALRPSLLHVGDNGLLLLLRFLSVSSGFRFLRDANFIGHELTRWKKVYNVKYVKILEDLLNQALTRHRRDENGTYGRRSTSSRHILRNAFVPPHMYGQLIQHSEGLELLLKEDCLSSLYQQIRYPDFSSESTVLHLKAALWAVGHVGAFPLGLPIINEADVVPAIINLCKDAPVFSVRGTCFYILGLLASTKEGADMLSQLGWEPVRHSHDEKWPLVKETVDTEPSLSPPAGRQHTWSISSGCSQWSDYLGDGSVRGGSHSSPSFILTTPAEDNGHITETSGNSHRLLAKSISYSLDLEERYATKPERRTFTFCAESSKEPDATCRPYQTLPRTVMFPCHHGASVSRVRSYSDCKADDIHSYEAEMLECDQCRKDTGLLQEVGSNLSVPHTSKDRSSSFGETDDSMPSSVSDAKELSSSASELTVGRSQVVDRTTLLTLGPKEERSDSNESSNTGSTSKSRSGSCTDSTTSGVSSCDSSTAASVATKSLHLEHTQTLSPIASSTSLNTMVSRAPSHGDQPHRPRHLFLRQASSGIISRPCSLFGSPTSPESVASLYGYTSARDAHGYVTLRSIQRRRVHSVDMNGQDSGSLERYRLTKGQSMDPQMMSSFTFGEADKPPQSNPSRRSSMTSQSSATSGGQSKSPDAQNEEIRYVGLCLPTDIAFLFSLPDVTQRSSKNSNSGAIHDISWKPHVEAPTITELPKMENGLQLHTSDNCLVCRKVCRKMIVEISGSTLTEMEEFLHHCSDSPSSHKKATKSCASSVDSSVTVVPNSPISNGCSPLPEDNHTSASRAALGKICMRKEVIRLVTNLSSSVAVKSSEQGLLNLKQKSPQVFQDVCLYTEVSLHMAQYSFRLNARHFLQELFLDMTFDELYQDAEMILNLPPPVVSFPHLEESET